MSDRGLSVVIPTLGRPALLRSCLESLTHCVPAPNEVVIVDQSGGDRIVELVAEFGVINARHVRSSGLGRGLAVNEGLAAARHGLVMMTDDDCTVAGDWIGEGMRLMAAHPGAIVTGRVLPVGDSAAVPSTIEEDEVKNHTGTVSCGALYAGNMVCERPGLLAFGAFDDQIVPTAEDNDLCYRWLRAGRELRFEPTLVVWHHDWRSAEELECLYERYGRGQGRFYAKHLRTGDLTMLRFLGHDLYGAVRSMATARMRQRRAWADPRRAFVRGLLPGLAAGAPTRVRSRPHPRTLPGGPLDTLRRVNRPPQDQVRRVVRGLRKQLRKRARRVWPPVGFVRFGGMWRVTPISRGFTEARGQPVDRFYIERFLARYSGQSGYVGGELRGAVMEIGEDTYARRFGGFGRPDSPVDSVTVLHGDNSNPTATLVGDLVSGDGIPSDAYDCVICTQTLLLLYDVHAAVRTLHRCLKPGGVVLVTVPGISQICSPDIDLWGDHWRFTTRSARQLFEEVFPAEEVRVESHGNVLSSIAFLHGLAIADLRRDELEVNDPDFQLIITVRARKAG